MTNDAPNDADPLFLQEMAGESAVRTLFAIVHSRFRELEHAEKFSQQQLANRMGLTRSQISRWFATPSNMTLRSAAKVLAAMDRRLELSAIDPLGLQAIVAPPHMELPSAVPHRNVVPFIPRRVPTRQVFTGIGQRAAAADGPSQEPPQGPDRVSSNSENAGADEQRPPLEIGEFTVPQGGFRLLLDGATVLVELSEDSPAHIIFLGERRHELKASTKWSGAFEIIGLTDDEADDFLQNYLNSGAKAGWV